ncbi:MAG: hypothetical protein AAGA50_17555 [Pseudomonadota bacterium]
MLIIQVRDDLWSRPEDVQTTFDLLTVEDKKLFWIEGTTTRFDGYNYFGEIPEQMVRVFRHTCELTRTNALECEAAPSKRGGRVRFCRRTACPVPHFTNALFIA